jgi:Flp pilus assembly pilin Flp
LGRAVTWENSALTARARAKRRERGVTTVEYVLLVTVIFLPSVIVATTCFVHLVGWYADFVSVVSRPNP